MSQKIFKKFLAKDYVGINGEISAVEDQDKYFNNCLNYESAIGDSLRGRVGIQAAAGPGYFFGLFPYNYTRTTDQYDIVYDAGNTISSTKTTADGATMNKVIAINQQCWVLDTMNIVITQTNAGAYTWYSTVGTNVINLVIEKDGIAISTTSLGDGTTTNTTIYSLLGTIDALADLAVSRTTRGTCPPFAIVNGAQTTALVAGSTYGNTYSVTVANTPHNFYPGDIICFPQCTISGGTLNGVTTMAAGIVRTRTATVITYMGPKVTVTDQLVLGYMGQSAVGFPISARSAESGGVFTLSIPYWRYIPEGPNTEPSPFVAASAVDYGYIFSEALYLARNKTAASFYAPANAVNADNNLYIATSTRQPPIEAYNSTLTVGSATVQRSGVIAGLIKTDGTQLFRSGLPTPSAAFTVTAIAGATLTGTYKYKVFLRRRDAQGNIIEGTPTTPTTFVFSTIITYAAPNQTGSLNIASSAFGYPSGYGYAERSAYKDTLQASNVAGGFRIDDGAGAFPYFQVGDVCCFLDDAVQTAGLTGPAAAVVGSLHATRCTFINGSGANFLMSVADTSGANILDNTAISSGLTVVVLRTTSGGNQFYQLCEVPVVCFSGAAVQLVDNVTDATLSAKAQYIEIPIGKEHDPPPNCSIVCQHQGGLAVARGFSSPNTVYFSTADGIEYFPVASNSFDVPATVSGHISAIASDTDDRLAVFKSRAYYDVVGDLDGGAFSVNVKNEGDYGIASHNSLVRIRNRLIGICANGYVAIQNGLIDYLSFNDLNAKLITQPYFFQWSVAVNDSYMRNYLCTIPLSATSAIGHTIEYDQKNYRTFERFYSDKLDQAAGAAMVGDNLYHLSQSSPYCVFRRLERFSSTSNPLSNPGLQTDSFVDNVEAPFYEILSRPISLGEPRQYKTPIRFSVLSIPNEGVQDGWTTFSLSVATAASWTQNYLGSASPGGTSATMTFTPVGGVSPAFKDIQLTACKTLFYLLRMRTNTIRTAPFITSFELQFAVDYDKEDFMP